MPGLADEGVRASRGRGVPPPGSRAVADALVWAQGDLWQAADTLWLDHCTMQARLDPRHLHPAEKAIIARRVSAEMDPA